MNYTNQNDLENQSNQKSPMDIFNTNELLSFDQIENSENIYSDKIEEVNLEINIKRKIELIHKVYNILLTQLIIIIPFAIIATFSKTIQYFIGTYIFFLYIFIPMVILLPIFIVYSQGTLKGHIMILLFTIAVAYCIGFICYYSHPRLVIFASFMTFIISITLTLYAKNTSANINIESTIISILLFLLYLCCFLFLFIRINFLQIIISLICIILCSFYKIYDIQNIIEYKYYMIIFDNYMIFLHLYNILNRIFNIIYE